MPEQKSIITISRNNDRYHLDARGVYGGGFARWVSEQELASAIINAWQQYGSNPLGCEIIGEMPEETRQLVDRLQNSTDKAVFTIRVSAAEADLIRAAAESAGQSINHWARSILTKEATKQK